MVHNVTTPSLNRVNSDFKATESRKIIKKQNKKINRIQFIKESANVCQKYKIKNKYGHKK